MSYDELRAVNNIIVGNPETVIKKLTEIIQRLNPGYLHIYGNEGLMAHQDVQRSIALLGREVIPALHEIELQPYNKASGPRDGLSGHRLNLSKPVA
jgi:hypothetical protein